MARSLIFVAAAVCVMACGDPFEPRLSPNPDEPGEATLGDFRLAPLREPAAFDLINVVEVRTDQSSAWDFLFEIDGAGAAVLRPRNDVTGEDTDAGLQQLEASFEAVERAPSDGYVQVGPVTVSVGDVLAGISRRDPLFGSARCRHYGKFEVLAIDFEARLLTFRHLVNPNCENRTLIPGEIQRN